MVDRARYVMYGRASWLHRDGDDCMPPDPRWVWRRWETRARGETTHETNVP